MPIIVPDTSVIINGQLTRQIELGIIHDSEIIISQAVFDELQRMAIQKKNQSIAGLEEIKKLNSLAEEFNLTITVKGEHLTPADLKLASSGRIDTIIKDVARQHGATLYTSDKIQHLLAQTEGIKTELVISQPTTLEFLKYFDSETMSVHLKDGQAPLAKKGKPGSFKLVKISQDTLSLNYLKKLSSQILHTSSDVEISMEGASVIQYKDYRISITKPPFSDKFEITIVHPIAKLELSDYNISDKLMDNFLDDSRGVIIAGPPGSGKSTLASGLANYYHSMGRIIKTFESPRDLQVNSGITQYTKLNGSFANTADILLLVRPDHTIFDEVRRREDFETFSDLRLAGVGMVGVIHANTPLDAIQRFIGKVELGMIPNVLDTVIFIKAGQISKTYNLTLCVKVPTGMTESDLARPVIEIKDFEDDTLEYEIYTFGEENVIVPVNGTKTGIIKLAEEKIREEFKRYDPSVVVEGISNNKFKVMVNEKTISAIIGRGGSNITKIEKHLGVHIDVVGHDSEEVPFTFSESRNSILLDIGKQYRFMHVDLYVKETHILSSKIGRKGQIKIPKHSEAAKDLSLAESQSDIKIILKDS